ncbi:MAG: hypothetical protein DHS80DRAFT_21881 [Piptocephalis tieghemiana]|nr:MAG: hypothetical protein DHS80DRAFT_21881 [Piptocephalis tieghemiana]
MPPFPADSNPILGPEGIENSIQDHDQTLAKASTPATTALSPPSNVIPVPPTWSAPETHPHAALSPIDASSGNCRWTEQLRDCSNQIALQVVFILALLLTCGILIGAIWLLHRRYRRWRLTREDGPIRPLDHVLLYLTSFAFLHVLFIGLLLSDRLPSSTWNEVAYHLPWGLLFSSQAVHVITALRTHRSHQAGPTIIDILLPPLCFVPPLVILTLAALVGHYHEVGYHQLERGVWAALWSFYALCTLGFGIAWWIVGSRAVSRAESRLWQARIKRKRGVQRMEQAIRKMWYWNVLGLIASILHSLVYITMATTLLPIWDLPLLSIAMAIYLNILPSSLYLILIIRTVQKERGVMGQSISKPSPDNRSSSSKYRKKHSSPSSLSPQDNNTLHPSRIPSSKIPKSQDLPRRTLSPLRGSSVRSTPTDGSTSSTVSFDIPSDLLAAEAFCEAPLAWEVYATIHRVAPPSASPHVRSLFSFSRSSPPEEDAASDHPSLPTFGPSLPSSDPSLPSSGPSLSSSSSSTPIVPGHDSPPPPPPPSAPRRDSP